MNKHQLSSAKPPAAPATSFTPVRSGLLQRKCACGGTLGPSGECEACAQKRVLLQRKAVRSEPGISRESRFNHDFAGVPAQPNAPASAAQAHTSAGQNLITQEVTNIPRPSGPPHTPLYHDSGEANVEIRNGRGARSQGALELSEPSDPTEREADQISERLFPTLAITVSNGLTDAPTAVEETKDQAAGGRSSCMTCGSSSKLPGGIADRGRPLPAKARGEMELAFGTDLSAVRIHTNPGAAQLTRSLHAEAFTYGNDIFFDQGKYDTDSASGKRLLAHELTHTLQQRDAIAMLARQGEGRTTLQCVNENLSSAGVASWLIAIVGATCGLIFGIAGSPTGPGAAGTAAFGAAVCIAGVIGFSVGAVLGVISGCWSDPNFKSRGAHLK